MKLIKTTLIVTIISVVSLFTSCATKKTDEVTMPHNIISVKKGILMKETYEKGVQRIIEDNRENGSYKATEFAWIDLDSLKNYIKLLDKVSKLNNTKISGIRIYFSQYPTEGYNYSQEEKERLIPGRETLFFAPTIKANRTKLSQAYPLLENVPFSIQHDGTNKLVGKLKVIEELTFKNNRQLRSLMTTTNSDTSLEDNTDETSLLLNELAMFPPPKNN